ncbi:DNA-3-methyladenine glycosylase family protein [Cumulibacter manganitolerans]|uniref:DNA-3-methyladenine glycosylase family protein n=1 Tax=Cumulibacter manganitolerans TaxID=1884992 RepID=UPI001294FFDB|nr:DNA-3-methyladenine glycosylase 2 family protein [Cumulibacter manganitolerans]
MRHPDGTQDPDRTVRVLLSSRLDLARTLAPFRYGTGDPAYVADQRGIWRAFGTPHGAATALFAATGAELVVRAWGPGADWVAERAGRLAGLEDDPTAFRPAHPLIGRLHARFPGVRFARTDLVMESLVPAILSQKITGKEAFRSWRELLRDHGSPAPGPAPQRLRVPPGADVLRALDDAAWHRAGVDRAHRTTLRLVAARPAAIERLSALGPDDAATRLQSIRGIGVWTAAEVAQRAWGSPDHPSFGDYHIPASVGVALAGAPVDDAGMAALLEPFRPHRGRVVRLIELARIGKPRRGPRRTVPDFRDI